MATNPEYVAPAFLQNQGVDEIYARMKENAPADLDTSDGSMFADVERPVAVEKAEMVESVLNEAIKTAFPQWSYGTFLDMHAAMIPLTRKPAASAAVTLTISGVSGTVVPAGSKFATPASGDTPAAVFQTAAQVTIGGGGTVSATATAVAAGLSGNVASGTITLLVQGITGVTGVTNASAATGGSDEESDADLIERIVETRQSLGGAGSKTDYIRWAKEVPGIGDAFCIPQWQGVGTGTVKVIVIDANGQPANATLIAAVQEYIAPADGSGKAPIGAIVTVAAPTLLTVNYAFTVTPNTSEIITAIRAALAAYYGDVGVGGLLKYSAIFARIMGVEGVTDLSGLTVNGGTANIQLTAEQYPATGTVNGA